MNATVPTNDECTTACGCAPHVASRSSPSRSELARKAVANLQQNVFMSVAAVAVLVPPALLGVFSLTTGLLANEGIALLVILNGLRPLAPARRRLRATPITTPVEASP